MPFAYVAPDYYKFFQYVHFKMSFKEVDETLNKIAKKINNRQYEGYNIRQYVLETYLLKSSEVIELTHLGEQIQMCSYKSHYKNRIISLQNYIESFNVFKFLVSNGGMRYYSMLETTVILSIGVFEKRYEINFMEDGIYLSLLSQFRGY